MQETRIQFLGWEVPLEKETATHSSILAWRIPWMEEVTVHGVAKSQTQLSSFTFTFHFPDLEGSTGWSVLRVQRIWKALALSD